MNTKKIALLTFAFALAFTMFAFAEDSSADDDIYFGSEQISASGFDDMGNGTLKVPLENKSTEGIEVKVVVKEHGTENVKAETIVTVPGTDTYTASLGIGYSSSGSKIVDVYIYRDSVEIGRQSGIEINVSHSIWKASTTYIVIIVLIIVVIILVYVYMHYAPKKGSDEQTKTFTEMEQEKRNSKAKDSTSVEKYVGNSKRSKKK